MCQKYQDVPMFMHPLEPKRVCARVEYNMFGRRCVSCKSGLSSRVPTAPTHDPTVPQRFHSEVIGTRADRRWWAVPGFRIKPFFARIPLGQLKEKTGRPGNPAEPPRWPPSQQSQHSGADFAARLSGTDRLCFGGYRLGQLGLSWAECIPH